MKTKINKKRKMAKWLPQLTIALAFIIGWQVNGFAQIMSPAFECPQPTNLQATQGDLTTTAETLTWAAAGSCDVRYRESGAAKWQYVMNANSPLLLSCLKAAKAYEFDVTAHCYGTTDTHSVRSASSFTTATFGCSITPTGLSSSEDLAHKLTFKWSSTYSSTSIKKVEWRRLDATGFGSIGSGTVGAGPFVESSELTIPGTVKPNKRYVWRVKSKCNCPDSDWSDWTAWDTTSVTFRLSNPNSFTIEENELSIYPNPVANEFKLSFTSAQQENYLITLCDMTGREIFKEKIIAEEGLNEKVIDISKYENGVYLLTLKSAGGSQILKIVKE